MIQRLNEADGGLALPSSLVSSLKVLWRPDLEMCGFVFADESFAIVRNVAEDAAHNFQMHRGDVQDIYERHGDEIVGIFHTHSNNSFRPSANDIAGWPRAEIRYWIVTEASVSEWRRADESRAYLVCTNP